MSTITYIQVRKGMVLVGEGGELFAVVDRDLNTPGNWRAILSLKLKSLKVGIDKLSAEQKHYLASWNEGT